MRFALVLVVLGACFYEQDSPLPADFGQCVDTAPAVAVASPTWFRDVQPIIAAKCAGCHTDGGVAPFTLHGYVDVALRRAQIRDAVATGRMPPWQPADCCTTYLHDRSLSADERATLLRWTDEGAPVGQPGDAPLPPAPPPLGLPRVDLQAAMAAPFTPEPREGADELRCFLLDHEPIDRKRYITGFDFRPGARKMVHHVIAYAIAGDKLAEARARDAADARPGWDCHGDGGEIAPGTAFIGGWQPGDQPRVLPPGLGRELAAGTRIVLNVHYDTGHGVSPDLSTIDLMLEDRVERLERAIPMVNPLWFAGDGMKIDAGDPDAAVWFAYDPSDLITAQRAVEIHNVMLHMHELGSVGRLAILRRDGSTECLLNIPDWDFHWLSDYYLATPVRLEPGDRLYMECRWDNTAANQKIVNGELQTPRDLYWGTDQEMCGAVVGYSEAVQP